MPITEDKLCYTPPYAVDQPLKEVTQFEKKDGGVSVEAEFSDSKQKRSGRSKGSKNKKTLEREAQAAVTADGQDMNLC